MEMLGIDNEQDSIWGDYGQRRLIGHACEAMRGVSARYGEAVVTRDRRVPVRHAHSFYRYHCLEPWPFLKDREGARSVMIQTRRHTVRPCESSKTSKTFSAVCGKGEIKTELKRSSLRTKGAIIWDPNPLTDGVSSPSIGYTLMRQNRSRNAPPRHAMEYGNFQGNHYVSGP
jgi:hypothetical protein